MSTLNHQQPSPQSGGSTSRKRRRSSSLSSFSSSSDVVIILDNTETETETGEPSKPAPPQQSKSTVSSDKSQGDDESKILDELRRARDVLQMHRNQGTADATSSGGTTHAATNEKEIEYIPALVNRVIAESNRKGGVKRSVIVTELLVELVLGFVEPYVMQMSKERNTSGSNDNKKQGYNNDNRFLSMTSGADSSDYRDRAISWAVHRIKDLLRPVDMELGTDILELDALLSALGRYDGLAHERNVQEHLREALLRMKPTCTSMHSAAKGPERLNAADGLESNGALCETAKGDEGNGVEPTPSPTSVAECWSVSPEKWMEKVTKSTGTEDSNAEETESMDEAMESFPYLRQMKDFLKGA